MKILVVVDMQKDFIDGALGTPEAQAIVPNVKKKIEEFVEEGGEVVYTIDTHYADYRYTFEGQRLPVHCIANSDGWFIPDDLMLKNPRIVRKESFGSLDLPNYVYSASGNELIDSITVVGLCTDICVLANALILRSEFFDTPVIVDSSCCAGTTPESHTRALEAMKMCQIDIV